MDGSALEVNVRGYVAEGSQLPTEQVIPGNDSSMPRPKGTYASVLFFNHQVIACHNKAGVTELWIRSDCSLQWYREGCVEAALRFIAYADSDQGVIDANTLNFRVADGNFALKRMDTIVSNFFEKRVMIDHGILWCYYLTQTTENVAKIPLYFRQDGHEGIEVTIDG